MIPTTKNPLSGDKTESLMADSLQTLSKSRRSIKAQADINNVNITAPVSQLFVCILSAGVSGSSALFNTTSLSPWWPSLANFHVHSLCGTSAYSLHKRNLDVSACV